MMTNKEKYLKDNIDLEKLFQELTNYINKTQKPTYDKIKDFFNKNVPLLTKEERTILENIDKEEFAEICRYDVHLCVSHKRGEYPDEWCDFAMYNHLFQFIKERRRILY